MGMGSIGSVALPVAGGIVGGFLAAEVLKKPLGNAPGSLVAGIGGSFALIGGAVGGRTPLIAGGIGAMIGAGIHAAIGGAGEVASPPTGYPRPGDPGEPVWVPDVGGDDEPGEVPVDPGVGPKPHWGQISGVVKLDSFNTPNQLELPSKSGYVRQPGDILPDGEQLEPQDLYVEDYEGHRVLRFDSQVGNNGPGAMQLAMDNLRNGGTKTTQVIFTEGGGARQVSLDGEFVKDQHPEHDHLHFDDFEKYELYRQNPDGTVGELVGGNRKASFYITNIEQKDPNAPRSGWVDFSRVVADVQQGISVGWADIYGAGLQGQEIDVTDLGPGTYVLRQIFDPSNRIAETNETNNARDTVVQLG